MLAVEGTLKTQGLRPGIKQEEQKELPELYRGEQRSQSWCLLALSHSPIMNSSPTHVLSFSSHGIETRGSLWAGDNLHTAGITPET